jgi:hypothetical protein
VVKPFAMGQQNDPEAYKKQRVVAERSTTLLLRSPVTQAKPTLLVPHVSTRCMYARTPTHPPTHTHTHMRAHAKPTLLVLHVLARCSFTGVYADALGGCHCMSPASGSSCALRPTALCLSAGRGRLPGSLGRRHVCGTCSPERLKWSDRQTCSDRQTDRQTVKSFVMSVQARRAALRATWQSFNQWDAVGPMWCAEEGTFGPVFGGHAWDLLVPVLLRRLAHWPQLAFGDPSTPASGVAGDILAVVVASRSVCLFACPATHWRVPCLIVAQCGGGPGRGSRGAGGCRRGGGCTS